MTKLLEVCVDNLEDAMYAARNGADRLELCGVLSAGGVTPSDGFVRAAVEESGLQCIALVRPRSGDFLFTRHERYSMRRDVESLFEAGCHGVAVGALTAEARLDRQALAELVQAAGSMEVVLHRAFDATQEPLRELETAVELGFRRVLTSGGAAQAPAGVEQLARLVQAAAGRIEILPGGGVRSSNALELLRVSGATQLHASCGVLQPSLMSKRHEHLVLGRNESGAAENWRIDQEELRSLRAILDSL